MGDSPINSPLTSATRWCATPTSPHVLAKRRRCPGNRRKVQLQRCQHQVRNSGSANQPPTGAPTATGGPSPAAAKQVVAESKRVAGYADLLADNDRADLDLVRGLLADALDILNPLASQD